MERFWQDVLNAAESINVKENLPHDWEVMAEMTR
jgi:hypothetical protein